MPKLSVHCAISRERTGYDFEDLHRWIDDGQKKHGCDHRKNRHAYNREEEREIKKRWDEIGKRIGKRNLGEKAVVEWLFHIAIDNINTAYKRSRVYGERRYNRIIMDLTDSQVYCDYERTPK